MPKPHRRDTGSILLLMLCVLCFLVVPTILLAGQLAVSNVGRTRTQSVVEAAGLVAANDLSRIIINDASFGYVSLSNYPPIGKATCAPDGEPLPVLGINTLVGTIRQNTIIAHELDNETMVFLAETDHTRMQETIKELNATIKNALTEGGGAWTDIQGAKVQPLDDVTVFLQANLPRDVSLKSVKLTNGWLSDGGDSTIALPQPLSLAQVKGQGMRGGKYKAFTDIPADHQSFTFAGVGPSSSLVNAATFHPADGKHICSIVKIECTVALNNSCAAPFGLNTCSQVQSVACCQPFSMAESGPAGAMTLRFSGGPVAGMQNWRDFLGGAFRDTQILTYEAVGGDYPVDKQSRIAPSDAKLPPNTSQQFAGHLYYWLRNGHLRPRIDAVLEMMGECFRSGPAQIYAYEFAKDGSISRRIIARDPFPVGVTSESQSQTVVDTSIQGGLTPIIIFRNHVENLGTGSGGQHAGQPLAGYPLNWCELADYGGDEHTAAALGKGRLGTKLTIIDPSGAAMAEEAINNPIYSLFQSFDGKRVMHQPRRSFYSGGLAVDIEIGGTTAPQPLAGVLNIPQQALHTGPEKNLRADLSKMRPPPQLHSAQKGQHCHTLDDLKHFTTSAQLRAYSSKEGKPLPSKTTPPSLLWKLQMALENFAQPNTPAAQENTKPNWFEETCHSVSGAVGKAAEAAKEDPLGALGLTAASVAAIYFTKGLVFDGAVADTAGLVTEKGLAGKALDAAVGAAPVEARLGQVAAGEVGEDALKALGERQPLAADLNRLADVPSIAESAGAKGLAQLKAPGLDADLFGKQLNAADAFKNKPGFDFLKPQPLNFDAVHLITTTSDNTARNWMAVAGVALTADKLLHKTAQPAKAVTVTTEDKSKHVLEQIRKMELSPLPVDPLPMQKQSSFELKTGQP